VEYFRYRYLDLSQNQLETALIQNKNRKDETDRALSRVQQTFDLHVEYLMDAVPGTTRDMCGSTLKQKGGDVSQTLDALLLIIESQQIQNERQREQKMTVTPELSLPPLPTLSLIHPLPSLPPPLPPPPPISPAEMTPSTEDLDLPGFMEWLKDFFRGMEIAAQEEKQAAEALAASLAATSAIRLPYAPVSSGTKRHTAPPLSTISRDSLLFEAGDKLLARDLFRMSSLRLWDVLTLPTLRARGTSLLHSLLLSLFFCRLLLQI
jgi:hypothetical protein